MICIGQNVVCQGKVYKVHDRDNINRLVRIGIVDKDGMCWDTSWVDISDVQDIHEVNFIDGVRIQ